MFAGTFKSVQTFADTTASLYRETVQLNEKINAVSGQLAESRRQNEEQKAVYEESYETLLGLAKTNAIIVSASDYENMRVYVTGKARYLITESGADAEFKTDKAIKGKIFRAEDDSVYIVVGEDKEGNRLEVDFSTLLPGTPVKSLSK